MVVRFPESGIPAAMGPGLASVAALARSEVPQHPKSTPLQLKKSQHAVRAGNVSIAYQSIEHPDPEQVIPMQHLHGGNQF